MHHELDVRRPLITLHMLALVLPWYPTLVTYCLWEDLQKSLVSLVRLLDLGRGQERCRQGALARHYALASVPVCTPASTPAPTLTPTPTPVAGLAIVILAGALSAPSRVELQRRVEGGDELLDDVAEHLLLQRKRLTRNRFSIHSSFT